MTGRFSVKVTNYNTLMSKASNSNDCERRGVNVLVENVLHLHEEQTIVGC